MFGPLLPGAIWVNFRVYWGWEPASRTPKPHTETGFSPARHHAGTHTSGLSALHVPYSRAPELVVLMRCGMIASGWSAVGPWMAVSASPAARTVRTACFDEQMEQKKQLLLASSQKSYPPAFNSLNTTASSAAASWPPPARPPPPAVPLPLVPSASRRLGQASALAWGGPLPPQVQWQ
jgi:hypothetical protein